MGGISGHYALLNVRCLLFLFLNHVKRTNILKIIVLLFVYYKYMLYICIVIQLRVTLILKVMNSKDYFYNVVSEMQRNHKTMNAINAESYLREKYPNAEVFTGVSHGGILDIMVAQQYNANAGEFDNEYTELEIIILN